MRFLFREKKKSATQRHNFFRNRLVPRWNKLPEVVVSTLSLVAFKSDLYEHHKSVGCYGHSLATVLAATPLNQTKL